MTMGMKLNALGIGLSLVFSHYLAILFPVGAIISAIGLFMIFFAREG